MWLLLVTFPQDCRRRNNRQGKIHENHEQLRGSKITKEFNVTAKSCAAKEPDTVKEMHVIKTSLLPLYCRDVEGVLRARLCPIKVLTWKRELNAFHAPTKQVHR